MEQHYCVNQKKTLTLIQDPEPELWNKTSVDPQNSTVVNSWNLHKTPLKKHRIKLYKINKKMKILLPFSLIWNLMEGMCDNLMDYAMITYSWLTIY